MEGEPLVRSGRGRAVDASQMAPAAERTALLVVDMQNDFCLPDAPLCVKGAMNCLPKVCQAVETARRCGAIVIWVVREHLPSGLDVEYCRKALFEDGGKGATVAGTDGAKLVEGLSALDGEPVVIKRRWSGFFATHLDLLLRRLAIEHVVVSGVQTPNCIRATAYDAVALDYPQVSVLGDATASSTDVVQQSNLYDMAQAGIAILDVDTFQHQLCSQ